MEFELVLRKIGLNSGCFIIPSIFLKDSFANNFIDGKLIVGKKYRLIIESIEEKGSSKILKEVKE